MRLKTPGISTSEVEVANIDSHGFWLLISEKEYFLSYEDYPWFKDAKVRDIINVQLLHESHLHWPELDVDLDINLLEDPGQSPLIYQ